MIFFFSCYSYFLENDIDGDAFSLLNKESLRDMIKSQGLLLKFEEKFSQLQRSASCDSASNVTIQDKSESDNPVSQCSSRGSRVLSEEMVREESKIYGRHKQNSKLTAWQEAVNAAAYEIATGSPDMMYDRSLLKIQAEEKARKTFIFKKKSGSRSKYEDSESKEQSKKRRKLSTDERAKEIRLCSLELQSLTAECENKEKQISQANDLKAYDRCAAMQKELRILLREKQQLKNKLSELQKKEARHLKYLALESRVPSSKTRKEDANISMARSFNKDITSFFNLKTPQRNSTKSSTTSIEENDEQRSQRKEKLDDGTDKIIGHGEVFVPQSPSSHSSTSSKSRNYGCH